MTRGHGMNGAPKNAWESMSREDLLAELHKLQGQLQQRQAQVDQLRGLVSCSGAHPVTVPRCPAGKRG